MRIGLISPPWLAVPPTGYGGTERIVDTLARALVELGHDVLLLTSGDSTCPVPRRTTLPRAVGTDQASPAVELRHVIAAYAHAREANVDIVHDHSLVGPFFARRFPWLPVVTTNHGPFEGDLGEVYRAMADLVPVIAISHNQAAGPGAPHPGRGGHPPRGPSQRLPGREGPRRVCRLRRPDEPDQGGARRVPSWLGRPTSRCASPRSSASRKSMTTSTAASGRCSAGRWSSSASSTAARRSPCWVTHAASSTRSPGQSRSAWSCWNPSRPGRPSWGHRPVPRPRSSTMAPPGSSRTGRRALLDALLSVGDLDRHACRATVEQRFTARRMAQRHLTTFDEVTARWPAPHPIVPVPRHTVGPVDCPRPRRPRAFAVAP